MRKETEPSCLDERQRRTTRRSGENDCVCLAVPLIGVYGVRCTELRMEINYYRHIGATREVACQLRCAVVDTCMMYCRSYAVVGIVVPFASGIAIIKL